MADEGRPLGLTSKQCRRARELLGWDMLDLEEASGVGMVVIVRLEEGRRSPEAARVATLRKAFEAAGVEFQPGGEARVRGRQAEG